MAYNFFPTGYQPYQIANFQNTNAQSNLTWVAGETAAKSYPIAPNSAIALWDSEANVIYVKSADASGMPTIKTLDYTMRDNTPKTGEILATTDFATKQDILHIQEEIDAIKSKFTVEEKEEKSEKEKKNGK